MPSGSYNFSLSRNDIIKAALRLLAVTAELEEPTGEQIKTGTEALNRLIKMWQQYSSFQFGMKQIVVFPDKTKNKYILKNTGDYACLVDDLIKTTTTSTILANTTIIPVTNISNINDGDFIGIVQDDLTIHWSTVNGTPIGLNVIIANAITYQATNGSKIFVFTKKIEKPLRLKNGMYSVSNADAQAPMKMISQEQYFKLTNKTIIGTPNQYYYQPYIDYGLLYIYSIPQSPFYLMEFTADMPFDDMDISVDTLPFPVEWYEPIVYNLAIALACEYGVVTDGNQTLIAFIKDRAEQYKQSILNWDQQNKGFIINPILNIYQ